MILHKDQYLKFIQERGVGKRDRVASSPDSYVSYLNSVSRLIGKDLTPAILSTEADMLRISDELQGQRAPTTIGNYRTAMRQYVQMVESLGLT